MTSVWPVQLQPLVALDLEVSSQGSIRHIGAVKYDGQARGNDQCFEHKNLRRRDETVVLQNLDDFCRNARFVLGHNLIGHDLPILRSQHSQMVLLHKRVIDTLYLSPLAFPSNPYHQLVKDYKRVQDSINEPVADARLSLTIFKEQYEEFQQQAQQQPDLIRFFYYCFASELQDSHSHAYQGLAAVFETLIAAPFSSHRDARQALTGLCRDKVCPEQLKRVISQYGPDPRSRIPLAYCVAWLQVAGKNSVLPQWVRHQFSTIPRILEQLREEHCGQDECAYCADNHDPVRHLQRFFQYQDFRVTNDGRPLQRDLVVAGMQGKSLLGILPTSGGKSLCFQVPALVRYYRRGLLTVIISPLQALMKDQVDNLKERTGSTAVAAVYGLLTPPERGAILEQVRLGDIGLLYLSPEQLRNRSVRRVLRQREIACWVFDEAHCLSQWGHDFRPDYLYCGRFIREEAEKHPGVLPMVACFTATAKDDVIADIQAHFKSTLGLELEVKKAGVNRRNLQFEVHLVTQAAKYGRVVELIEERLPEDGSCIVYCATRRGTEELARFLTHRGLIADHFHGKLEAPAKKSVMDLFLQDEIRIICATNAFGMGVDKENVRLVVHAEVPGSLEHYLQEAGRAGRDGKMAHCILLFDEQDIETQFKLGALAKVHQRDIQQVLRGIRRQERKKPGQDVVITTGELLRSEEVDTSFDLDDSAADTKVKTAVAWLERSGFLERNENSTQVFNGEPLFATLEEAKQRLDRLQLLPAQRRKWEMLLQVLIDAEPDEGLNADYLAEQIGRLSQNDNERQLKTVDIMRILNQMAQAGIVSHGLLMTAFLRPRGRNNAQAVFADLCRLESKMLDLLIQAHPAAEKGIEYPLDLRLLNQQLLDSEFGFSNPRLLRNLLKSLAADGKGLAASRGSIDIRYVYKDNYAVKLNRCWQDIWKILGRRHVLSAQILEGLYQALEPSEQSSRAEVLVQFSLQDLLEAIRPTQVRPDRQMAALERGLLFLHEQNVIILQQGLAVFRQAMTLKVKPESRSRRYNKGDYDPLDRHYKARVTQVHIMNEYVQLGLDNMITALTLVRDYFAQTNVAFLNQYFRGRRELLALATSQQSYNNIVDSLGNPHQESIVRAPVDENILVLAGPGSGKTRVVVHRCAYLTRVHRVRSRSILVLCFNHSAAVALRKRLKALLGHEASGISVYTFHGLAMRLLGHAFDPRQQKAQGSGEFDFDQLICKATALLKGETALPGIPDDQIRERMLSGIQHILVDEYQDIDAEQYDMISAIAGRTLGADEEKLSILAVGDDDQSIYGFRRANVKYIRQFKEDYRAQIHYLTQNYRSTRHIITAANRLIGHNQDRMKTEQAIRINDARRAEPPGGTLAEIDRVGQGKVLVISCPDVATQTTAAVQELARLRDLCPDLEWSDCAVLARWGLGKSELTHFRSAVEHEGIPISFPLKGDQTIPLFRVREFNAILAQLHRKQEQPITSQHLREWIDDVSLPSSPWQEKLRELIENWEEETEGSKLPASAFCHYLTDYLREVRREQRFGDGVHVGTVHSAKGLEFRVVVLLDGSWEVHSQREREEERRLFYVGMTRAMDCLVILQRDDAQNPHVPLLDDDSLHERSYGFSRPYPLKEYRTLGMPDLYLSYAGGFVSTHVIHTRLRQLNAGDTVDFNPAQGTLLSQGHTIAKLSQKSRERAWPQFNGTTIKGRVLALAQRRNKDSEEAYQDRHKCEEWEIPIVELAWDAQGQANDGP